MRNRHDRPIPGWVWFVALCVAGGMASVVYADDFPLPDLGEMGAALGWDLALVLTVVCVALFIIFVALNGGNIADLKDLGPQDKDAGDWHETRDGPVFAPKWHADNESLPISGGCWLTALAMFAVSYWLFW